MDKVKRSIRLPIAVANAVKKQAELRGISQYALLELCIHQGLSKLINEGDSDKILNDTASKVGTLNSNLAHLTRLVERVLYVSSASYAFSRVSVASSHRFDEATINQEIQQAFLRQLNLAGGFDEQQ